MTTNNPQKLNLLYNTQDPEVVLRETVKRRAKFRVH